MLQQIVRHTLCNDLEWSKNFPNGIKGDSTKNNSLMKAFGAQMGFCPHMIKCFYHFIRLVNYYI